MMTDHNLEIKEHMDQCKAKIEYHKKNADNSLAWHNLLGIISIIITGMQALIMTVFIVLKQDEATIAITGGIFALATLVFNRVQTSYNFNVLNVLHNQISDDYGDNLRDFSLIDPEDYDHNLFLQYTYRHISIVQKGHLQPVKHCALLNCCC